jgi:hypothetical protein
MRWPPIEVSTTSARASRVKSSTMHRMRKRRPHDSGLGDEVEAPALVRPVRQGHGRTGAGGALAATPSADRQALLSVEPEELLPVHGDAFTLEQDADRR